MKNNKYDLKETYANLAFDWCKKNLGKNKRKKRKLEFKFSNREGYLYKVYDKEKTIKRKYSIFGRYCEIRNLIVIYEPNCRTLNEIVSTVIHEYTHYLQSMYQYKKYDEIYYYSLNPLEKEAQKNEELYTKQCIKDIKLILECV
jgi:uncharacterized protein YjaZ